MVNVVFVAPFFLPTTMRFVDAVASLPDVRLGLISQHGLDQLTGALRSRLSGHYQVADCMDPRQIAKATQFISGQMGGVHRLLGALEQLQIQLGQVRDHLGIPGMGEAVARNFREKGRMKDIFTAAGLPCARHREVTAIDRAAEFAAQVGYPLVVKPPAGAGAVATYRVDNDGQLAAVLGSLGVLANGGTDSRSVVLEEFVTGQENSFETVSIDGKPVWDSHTKYLPAPLHVVENPWIQWTVLLPREVNDGDTAAVRDKAYRGIQALGMGTGLTHMEWFHTSRGAVISEVAARPPGAQIIPLNSYAHDIDFFRVWARLMVHGEFVPPERKYATGAAFFRGQTLKHQSGESMRTGRIVKLHGLDKAQEEIGHLVVDANLPTLGHHRASSYEGDGYAIIRHPDTEVVANALKRLVALVRVEVD